MMTKLIPTALIVLTLAGCYPIEKEYVWVRKDGDVFVVKWSIDAAGKLTLIEKWTASATSSAWTHPAAGTTTIQRKDYFLPCAVLDQNNWECASRTPEESIRMTDGVLTYKYWSETRSYKVEYKLAF